MEVLNLPELSSFCARHAELTSKVSRIVHHLRSAAPTLHMDLTKSIGKPDFVPPCFVVYNLNDNWRLIVIVNLQMQTALIHAILNHKEYMKRKWMAL